LRGRAVELSDCGALLGAQRTAVEDRLGDAGREIEEGVLQRDELAERPRARAQAAGECEFGSRFASATPMSALA
jgi:hypothetical protein